MATLEELEKRKRQLEAQIQRKKRELAKSERKARNHAVMVAGGLLMAKAPGGDWKSVDWNALAAFIARARRRDFGVRYAAARHGWGEQAPSRVGEGKAPAGVAALARCPKSALKEHGRRTLLRPCFGALKRLSDVHLCQIS